MYTGVYTAASESSHTTCLSRMRGGGGMEEWHDIEAVRQDTWRRRVAVTGMEGASVSSGGRERLDIQDRTEVVVSWQTRRTEALAGAHLLISGKAWLPRMPEPHFFAPQELCCLCIPSPSLQTYKRVGGLGGGGGDVCEHLRPDSVMTHSSLD